MSGPRGVTYEKVMVCGVCDESKPFLERLAVEVVSVTSLHSGGSKIAVCAGHLAPYEPLLSGITDNGHGRKTSKKTQRCDVCGESYKNVAVHRARAHGIADTKHRPKGSFRCSCGERFRDARGLAGHIGGKARQGDARHRRKETCEENDGTTLVTPTKHGSLYTSRRLPKSGSRT